MTAQPDLATVRRLMWHEAGVHAVPGRELRDLGDGFLLHDPVDPEPFWNRLAAVRWPSEPAAFDRRLAEIGILFAGLGRQPHIWSLPPHDAPDDLAARLIDNGFEDAGAGHLMAISASDAAATLAAIGPLGSDAVGGPAGIRLERFGGGVRPADGAGSDARADPASAIVRVLLEAFAVDAERGPGIVAETRASLADGRFTHYLVSVDGEPMAVCRRATFDGLSYLSSIGVRGAARGRGLARLATTSAMADAVAAGSEWIHLGVFADNLPAIGLYERLGFAPVGEPGPDLILVG